MSKSSDPYYSRSQVPNEFIEHVGQTGLSQQDEYESRERKFSVGGTDLRKFDTKKNSGFHPQSDPFYSRKPIPDSMIQGIGETGLSQEEEELNRERKYSVTGVDVRRFDTKPGSGFHPNNDPYYQRKPVTKSGIEGVGETNMSRAEEFDSRENKAHLFQDSNDPFQNVMGTGHRASVSAQAGPVAAEARRRSSAVAPDHVAAAASATERYGHGQSGYSHEPLAPIQSRREDDDIVRPSNEYSGTTTTTTTTTTTHTTPGLSGANTVHNDGHHLFHDVVTKDVDSVAPHQRV